MRGGAAGLVLTKQDGQLVITGVIFADGENTEALSGMVNGLLRNLRNWFNDPDSPTEPEIKYDA
jgi:hypothetical protein